MILLCAIIRFGGAGMMPGQIERAVQRRARQSIEALLIDGRARWSQGASHEPGSRVTSRSASPPHPCRRVPFDMAPGLRPIINSSITPLARPGGSFAFEDAS